MTGERAVACASPGECFAAGSAHRLGDGWIPSTDSTGLPAAGRSAPSAEGATGRRLLADGTSRRMQPAARSRASTCQPARCECSYAAWDAWRAPRSGSSPVSSHPSSGCFSRIRCNCWVVVWLLNLRLTHSPLGKGWATGRRPRHGGPRLRYLPVPPARVAYQVESGS